MNLTQEEIVALKTLRSNTEKITKEFGLIKLAKINLKKRESSAIEMLQKLENEEKEVVNILEKKYGQGSIDIDKGTFTKA